VKALAEAPDLRTAQVIVDEWLAENVFAPRPAEISREIRRRVGEEEAQRPLGDPNCEKCGGTGWHVVPTKIGGYTYDVAYPCECRDRVATTEGNGRGENAV